MRETWRFLHTGALDGPANMAVDEALLRCFDPERSLPVFRLYSWRSPALSLGRFQEAQEVLDLGRCTRAGIPVVGRITGGGVVFHGEELTYSLVCAPRHVGGAASVKESFRILTRFLLRFYRDIGLTASHAVDCLPAGTVLGQRSACCFAGWESYDILIGGKKIGGNAQRRLRRTIFQHGSIPLRNLVAHGSRFLREPPANPAANAAALEELGVAMPAEELQRLLAAAFAETMPALLSPGPLTRDERLMAVGLAGGAEVPDAGAA